MYDWQLKTPVAFFIFNRLHTTERVFAEIAKAKPPKLLVVADGPRPNRSGEPEKCRANRAIMERIDWDCEVLTNFSNVNLGCKKRMVSGINWVFEQVPEAIILEDDCLPHPSFFRFCQEMLERYRDDEHIAMISGINYQFGRKRGDASYYFSRFPHIWGWASWHRAWQYYDSEVKIWPALRDRGWLKEITATNSELRHWSHAFQLVCDGKIDTWDFQLVLAAWVRGMLSIVPNVNLISNIGFGPDATHTIYGSFNWAVEAMEFPLRHPCTFLADREADDYEARTRFSSPLLNQVLQKIKSIILKFRK